MQRFFAISLLSLLWEHSPHLRLLSCHHPKFASNSPNSQPVYAQPDRGASLSPQEIETVVDQQSTETASQKIKRGKEIGAEIEQDTTTKKMNKKLEDLAEKHKPAPNYTTHSSNPRADKSWCRLAPPVQVAT